MTIIAVLAVQKGGRSTLGPAVVGEQAATHDLLAVAGTEGLAAVDAAGLSPDLRFGTPEAVQEAPRKGLDVLLVAVTDVVSKHIDKLREHGISYEILESNA